MENMGFKLGTHRPQPKAAPSNGLHRSPSLAKRALAFRPLSSLPSVSPKDMLRKVRSRILGPPKDQHIPSTATPVAGPTLTEIRRAAALHSTGLLPDSEIYSGLLDSDPFARSMVLRQKSTDGLLCVEPKVERKDGMTEAEVVKQQWTARTSGENEATGTTPTSSSTIDSNCGEVAQPTEPEVLDSTPLIRTPTPLMLSVSQSSTVAASQASTIRPEQHHAARKASTEDDQPEVLHPQITLIPSSPSPKEKYQSWISKLEHPCPSSPSVAFPSQPVVKRGRSLNLTPLFISRPVYSRVASFPPASQGSHQRTSSSRSFSIRTPSLDDRESAHSGKNRPFDTDSRSTSYSEMFADMFVDTEDGSQKTRSASSVYIAGEDVVLPETDSQPRSRRTYSRTPSLTVVTEGSALPGQFQDKARYSARSACTSSVTDTDTSQGHSPQLSSFRFPNWRQKPASSTIRLTHRRRASSPTLGRSMNTNKTSHRPASSYGGMSPRISPTSARPRTPMHLKVHSQGSISAEMGNIPEGEDRRLTEVAFLY